MTIFIKRAECRVLGALTREGPETSDCQLYMPNEESGRPAVTGVDNNVRVLNNMYIKAAAEAQWRVGFPQDIRANGCRSDHRFLPGEKIKQSALIGS